MGSATSVHTPDLVGELDLVCGVGVVGVQSGMQGAHSCSGHVGGM